MKTIKSLYGNNSYVFILAIIVILNAATHWAYFYPDSICYTETTNYIFNATERGICVERQLNRPVTLILSGLLNPIIGLNNSFALVNTIFWFLGSILMYKFVMKLYGREKLAFYSSILFATSIPLLRYGAAVLTDSGGYFFTLLAVYMIYNLKDNVTIKRVLVLGIIFALGILTKNHLGFFIPIYFILSRFSQKRILAKGIFSLVIAFIAVMGFYYLYDVNTFQLAQDAEGMGYTYYNPEAYGFKNLLLSFGGFLYLPLFSILGFLADKDRKRLLNYYYMLIAFLPLFVWPAIEYRITFIMFPLIIPLASLGIENFSSVFCKKPVFSKMKQKYYEILIIILYIISSFLYVLVYHSQF